jgi:hypothetical protein
MYKLKFHTFAPIHTQHCTYKLASRNMVVVLAKQEKGKVWDTLEGEAGTQVLPPIEPRLMFKQNPTAATLLLQVAGVVEDSVKICFEKDMVEVWCLGDIDSRDLAMQQHPDHLSESGGVDDLGDGKRPYKLQFKPFAAVVPEKCSFKVASRNMVVVLSKKQQGEDWEAMKAPELFIPAGESGTFEGAKPGYVFKMGAEGLGYYKDIRAQPLVPARLNAENSENLGATNNSGPAEETIGKGTIAFANANQSAKESQGSIDAGSVTLVNQIMYELD